MRLAPNRPPGLMASTERPADAKWRSAWSPVQLAAVLAAVVLLASMVSVELGVTVALLELTLGVVVGNVFDLTSQRSGWTSSPRSPRSC